MLHDKKIFVTGGTGFLGGAIIHQLVEQGAAVKALVRNPDRAAYIRDLPNVTLVQGDITQPHTLPPALDGCQIVLHAAAALWGNLPTQLAINRDGTAALASAAADANVERFVHVSSISVYGYHHFADIDETTPPSPGKDPYPISKLAAETALRQIAAQRGLAFSIIRPGMIYGARSGMWTRRMFRLAKRRPTIFIGDGGGSAFPIHVEDVVALTLLLAEHPAALGETFNCAPDPAPTWRAFLGGYSRLVGHDDWFAIPPLLLKPIAWLAGMLPANSPLVDFAELLPFSQRRLTYKMTKANRLLNWQPQVSLEQGIARSTVWLRANGWL